MILSLAPMEGVTGHVFRRVHAECFGALDRYYTPFVAPPQVGKGFVGRAKKELDPAANEGLDVVPQLLTRDADRFVWAAGLLEQMGYREVNLNAGCPSGTVVSKGKGSGFLRDPAALGAFLLDVCERSPLPVSVKTRIGVEDDREFDELLPVFCRCPLAELIVHPRLQRDAYKGTPRWEPYGCALAAAPFAVAYNGDIFDADDLGRLTSAYPQTRHVMLGRGVLTNPALPRELRAGASLSLDELRAFHDGLLEAYATEMGGNAVFRMKEWWSYAKGSFANPVAVWRHVRKAKRLDEYRTAAARVFEDERLAGA